MGATTDGIDWTTAGPLAAAFVGGGFAFVKGWVVPGKFYDREIERNHKQAKQIETLQAAMQDEFLPAFRNGTDALRAVTPFLNSAVRSVESEGGG